MYSKIQNLMESARGVSSLALVALLILSVVSGSALAATGANLTINVEDSSGDVPDGDITITDTENDEVVVDKAIPDSGALLVEDLDDGDYTLEIYAYGYAISTHTLNVSNGDVYVDGSSTAQSSLDVTLADAQQYDTTFTVEDISDATGIEDAEVSFIGPDGDVVSDEFTDANGTAVITENEGRYDLRVEADGYQTIVVEDFVVDGTSSKTIQMQEGSDSFWAVGGGSTDGLSDLQKLILGALAVLGTLGIIGYFRD